MFIKIRPVGAELFHSDRQTDMTKLIVAFRNFANAPTEILKRLGQLTVTMRHVLTSKCTCRVHRHCCTKSHLYMYISYSMRQSSRWVDNTSSACQIKGTLPTRKFITIFRKVNRFLPVVSHLNSFQTVPSIACRCVLVLSQRLQLRRLSDIYLPVPCWSPLIISSPLYALHLLRMSHSYRLQCPDRTWWVVPITKLLIM
jgi:hypothetical protein